MRREARLRRELQRRLRHEQHRRWMAERSIDTLLTALEGANRSLGQLASAASKQQALIALMSEEQEDPELARSMTDGDDTAELLIGTDGLRHAYRRVIDQVREWHPDLAEDDF